MAGRVAAGIPLLLVIATLTFALVRLIPGDPAAAVLGPTASREDYQRVHHALGVDRPVVEQYVDWLGNVVRGDLGRSLVTGAPVTSELGNALPVTLSLAFGASLAALFLGVPIGVASAVRGGAIDGSAQAGAGFAMAIPSFWLALLLQSALSIGIPLLPATGYVRFADAPGEWALHLILPLAAIGIGGAATIMRQTRAAMIDALARDSIRTLLAAGVPRRSVVFKHALRNASIPVVTSFGFLFIGVLGGAVIIEQVFALPGMGRLTVNAVSSHDLPLVQGVVLYTAGIVLLVNLAIDVISALLDPRSRAR